VEKTTTTTTSACRWCPPSTLPSPPGSIAAPADPAYEEVVQARVPRCCPPAAPPLFFSFCGWSLEVVRYSGASSAGSLRCVRQPMHHTQKSI
jgi:hypothetical protein